MHVPWGLQVPDRDTWHLWAQKAQLGPVRKDFRETNLCSALGVVSSLSLGVCKQRSGDHVCWVDVCTKWERRLLSAVSFFNFINI